jgi:uncharacterized protein YcgI (DUF1989 family)
VIRGVRVETLVPARHAVAVEARRGQSITIVDVKGKQVGDLCAVSLSDTSEYMDLTPTRLALSRLQLKEGDELLTNRRRPILRLADDPIGTHDMIFGGCDKYRYEVDFGITGHRNCQDNLLEALNSWVIDETTKQLAVREILNVFINQKLDEHGTFHLLEPVTRAGDSVTFKALIDAIVALSSCPESQSPCNGYKPTEMLIRVE